MSVTSAFPETGEINGNAPICRARLKNNENTMPVKIDSRLNAELRQRLCVLLNEMVRKLCFARCVTQVRPGNCGGIDTSDRCIIEEDCFKLSWLDPTKLRV